MPRTLGGFRPITPLGADAGKGGAPTPWYRAGGAPTPIAAYQAKGAASLAASYVNLANPGTYNLTVTAAPTLGASGWAFNGTTQFLKTGIMPDNGWSVIVQFSSVTAANATLVGADPTGGPAPRLLILTNFSSAVGYTNGNLSPTSVSPTLQSGNLCMAGTKAYRNGVDESVTLGAWSGAALSKELYIGARNNNATADLFCNGNIAAVALYNAVLTAAQVLAVYTAMAAL